MKFQTKLKLKNMRKVSKLHKMFKCIFITIYLLSLSKYINAKKFQLATSESKFWNGWPPGHLLHALDRLTSEAEGSTALNIPPIVAPPTIQRRKSSSSEETANTYSTEDHLNQPSSQEYDYDKAYDEFVRKYFSKSSKEHSAEFNSAEIDDDNEPQEQLESVETTQSEPESAEAKTYQKKTKPLERKQSKTSKKLTKNQCKKVKRKQQICEICKNPKTGENSESCEYSSEDKPQKYAFARSKNYKKQKTPPKSENEDESNAEDDFESINDESSAESTIQKTQLLPRDSVTEAAISSSCIKKVEPLKICYYCKNNRNESSMKCFAYRSQGFYPYDQKSGNNSQHKTQQRIYKRTISYSYDEKHDESKDDINNKTTNSTARMDGNMNENDKKANGKYMIRIIKRSWF